MEDIAIDVHKKESQIEAINSETGEVTEKRIRTERRRLEEEFGGRPRARILIEASTESEWVARCLEKLGHEVIVADPNFAPMYLERTRQIKTDRRDAHALVVALQLGAFRKAHRTSEKRRRLRARLTVREGLVRTRAKMITLVESLLRREGYRVGTGSSEAFLKRVQAVSLPGAIKSEIAPLLAALVVLNREIRYCDDVLEKVVETDPEAKRLKTMPNIGPVTATAFAAVVDDAKRFRGAHQVEAYLGLVPREYSSGDKQHRGAITKAGGARVRSLLIQAGWGVLVLRRKDPRTEVLRQWGERIASRRGKKIAAVALARRIAGILYAMLRDEKDYEPTKLRAAPVLNAA